MVWFEGFQEVWDIYQLYSSWACRRWDQIKPTKGLRRSRFTSSTKLKLHPPQFV